MTEKQPHAVNKRDRPTYQINESHTLAHTHSWLPETNKYKHDLALSPRKITVVSWRTGRTARSQTLTPTRAPAAENAEEAMELEGSRLGFEIRRKVVCLTFTPRLAWWTSFSGHVSKHLATQATRPNSEPCRSARSVRLASQLTGLRLTLNEHLRSHLPTWAAKLLGEAEITEANYPWMLWWI